MPTPSPPFCFTSHLMTYLHQHSFGAFALVIGKAQDLGKFTILFRIRHSSICKIYWQKWFFLRFTTLSIFLCASMLFKTKSMTKSFPLWSAEKGPVAMQDLSSPLYLCTISGELDYSLAAAPFLILALRYDELGRIPTSLCLKVWQIHISSASMTHNPLCSRP